MATSKFDQTENYNKNVAAIRALKQIELLKTTASSDQIQTLKGYVGWGGLSDIFPNSNGEFNSEVWSQRNAELKSLLSESEYDSMRSSILDAFFTPSHVTGAMWNIIENLNISAGIALEPSCGNGRFLYADEHAKNFHFLAIEKDPITARLAKLINNKAACVFNAPFEAIPLPEGMCDIVIGNPPYGSFKANFKNNSSLNRYSIHNQFILASLYALKENGIGAFVVSRYVMDATASDARYEMARMATLLGAFRLPNNAFKADANTSVVTDILIFRRNGKTGDTLFESEFTAPSWVSDLECMYDPQGNEIAYNSYFSNSTRCGGDMAVVSSQFGFTLDVVSNDQSELKLTEWVENFKGLAGYVSTMSADDIQAAYDQLVAHINIELSGKEVGVIDRNDSGELYRVIEQDVKGNLLFKTQVITADVVWSEKYILDISGQYYEKVPKINAAGLKVYEIDEHGCETNRLVYDKKFIDLQDISSRSKLGATRLEKLEGLTNLRDCLLHQINLELADNPDMEQNRKTLNDLYSKFTKKFGWINSPSNESLIGGLPDGGLLLSLEYDYVKPIKETTGINAAGKKTFRTVKKESAKKSAIFERQVTFKKARASTADNAEHALALSLGHYGFVNIDYMAILCNVTGKEIIDQLFTNAVSPKIFFDHSLGGWVHHSIFLSGDVASKLKKAKLGDCQKTIEALIAVQPIPIEIENISISIGMTWIPDIYYSQFVQFISDDEKASVRYERISGSFNVSCHESPTKSAIFATEKVTLTRILESLLNKSELKVTYTVKQPNGTDKIVVDQEATEQAVAIAESIKNEFFDWVYSKPEILEHLGLIYNERFNGFVVPVFDGSHLVLDGKVPDDIIKLRPHQLNAVYRGIATNAVLYDHQVGSGKTFTSIARAMERQRLGLSKKPLIIVPNHLVGQFAADVYRLYPAAKLLVATKKDAEKSRRKRLFSRIATGDYELIIMAHSSFEFIKLSDDQQAIFMQEELSVLQNALNDEEVACEGGKKTRSAKMLAYRIRKLEAKIERLIQSKRKDKLLSFEQLGITDIGCDECQVFKNLNYISNLSNISGMGNPEGSNRAFDLYIKLKYLHRTGGSVAFLTGTPISNSAVEMHAMMRYLMPDTLCDLDLENFDNWAKTYAENGTKFEVTESGKLKAVSRFARTWNNMQSLMSIWYQVADPITNEDLQQMHFESTGKHFPIPRIKGGERQVVAIEPTTEQQILLDEVLQGFNSLDLIGDWKDRNASRLRLMDKARKLSLAARCANPERYRAESGGKLEAVADNVFEQYQAWDDYKGTQLIFLDRSVPRSNKDAKIIKEYDAICHKLEIAAEQGNEDLVRLYEDRLERFNPFEVQELKNAQNNSWSAYQEIKDLLIAKGMPSNTIRFIQEAKTDQQKKDLFDLVRVGEVRVLIGSSERMGAGTNVQERLVHLHHVDIGWRPSDISQREGRILRQGNLIYAELGHDNFEVGITAYVTKRTTDAKLWEVNSAKLKMLNAIRNYKGEHTIDFGEDADCISMQEIAALASGNPLMLERVELDAETQSLERLRKTHLRKLSSMAVQCKKAEKYLITAPEQLSSTKVSAQVFTKNYTVAAERVSDIKVNVSGIDYDVLKDALDAIATLGSNKQDIFINDLLLSYSKAKEKLTSLFMQKTPFMFIDGMKEEYKYIENAADDVASTINRSRNDYIELGHLFGLVLTCAKVSRFGIVGRSYIDWDFALSTIDGKHIVAQTSLQASIFSKVNIKGVLNKLIALTLENVNTFEQCITRKINEAVRMVRELTPLISQPFAKQAELDFKVLRLQLIEEALKHEDVEEALSELMIKHNEEIQELGLKVKLASVKAKEILQASVTKVVSNEVPEPVVVQANSQVEEVMQHINKTVEATKDGCEILKEKGIAKQKSKSKNTYLMSVDGNLFTVTQMDLF